MTAVSCSAPRCGQPATVYVAWLPWCSPHGLTAEQNPAAVAALHPTPTPQPRLPAVEVREREWAGAYDRDGSLYHARDIERSTR